MLILLDRIGDNVNKENVELMNIQSESLYPCPLCEFIGYWKIDTEKHLRNEHTDDEFESFNLQ